MSEEQEKPTARQVLDKQLDDTICSFDFKCCVDSLGNNGWMVDLEPELLESALRRKALEIMRKARDGVIEWLHTEENLLVYKVDQYPLIAQATICRESGNTWARMDLIAYAENTINDGDDCTVEPE